MFNIDYVYNKSHFGDVLNVLSGIPVTDKELGVTIVDNGTILPSRKSPVMQQVWGLGGVVDSKGKFVQVSTSGAYEIKIFGGYYEYDEADVSDIEDEVLFLGPITQHWGSFLVDQLSRLWYVVQKSYKGKIAYCGVNFTEGTFGSIDKPARQLFELLGIGSDRLIDIRKPSRFSRVIIPELSFAQGQFITKEYKDIYQTIADNVIDSDWPIYDKLYLTRTAIKKRKEVGEEKIEEIFAGNGFKVLSMEKLSVAEQVHYMKHCSVVASIDGTVAHNILFAKKCTKQIVLEKQSRINPYQHLFNELMGVQLEYIDVYSEPYKGYPLNHDDGPFLVYVSEKLERYISDNGLTMVRESLILKLMNRIKYTWMCFVIGVLKPGLGPVYMKLKRLIKK